MRQLTLISLTALCGILTLSHLALATVPTPSLLLPFDATQGEIPESVALDETGNVYFTLGNTIQLRTLEGTRSVWATLPISAFALGVKVGPDGCVYTASTSLSGSPGAYVWRACGGGPIEVYATLDQTGGPNDLAFDDEGNLYVTDAFLGQIWQITADGNAHVWLTDRRTGSRKERP